MCSGSASPCSSQRCGSTSVSVCVRSVMARGEQRRPQLGKVVDLAVLRGGDGAVLVGQRLAAAVDVDDAEPPGAEREPSGRDTTCSSSGPRWRSVAEHARRPRRDRRGRRLRQCRTSI